RGVGWARKVLLEAIAAERDDNEAVISLDADTGFGERYMESVLNALNAHPHHSALAVPYRHPLTGEETNDRAMLRYEIYMRHYLINLLGIKERLRQNGSCADMPYAFTALGSAMAFPLWAYRRVGGYTPLQGGEDFYLMQKFAKTGSILLENNEMVYPQGRASLRVPFGTGPAIAKGVAAMNESYPIYPHEGFEAIEATYSLFPKLFEKDMATPMTAFLHEQLRTDDLWQPLRKNFKTKTLFVHASQERVDGLRMLQFLKTLPHRPAETELQHFCKTHGINIPEGLSFLNSPISDINTLRDALFHLECEKRRQHSIPAETRNV
ncbi:MAG: hypothetical protein IJ640_06415, partial [Prevotella sp.]|nr:hypothetical protein [Prevotella sp.]